MKSIENQFSEFINLSYRFDPELINRQVGDFYISDFVILRKNKISWDFIMLTTGERISIPYVIIDIFKSLDVYHRGNIFRTKAILNIETFIQLMLALVHNIESNSFDTVLESLDLIQKIGVKGFLDYLDFKFGINLHTEGVMCVSKKDLIVYI